MRPGQKRLIVWGETRLLILMFLIITAISVTACGSNHSVIEKPGVTLGDDSVVEETEPGVFTNSDPAVEDESTLEDDYTVPGNRVIPEGQSVETR